MFLERIIWFRSAKRLVLVFFSVYFRWHFISFFFRYPILYIKWHLNCEWTVVHPQMCRIYTAAAAAYCCVVAQYTIVAHAKFGIFFLFATFSLFWNEEKQKKSNQIKSIFDDLLGFFTWIFFFVSLKFWRKFILNESREIPQTNPFFEMTMMISD